MVDGLPLARLAGRCAMLWLAGALLMFSYWLPATFGDVSLGQILFHWRYLEGTSAVAPAIAADCFAICGAIPLLVALLATWFEHRVAAQWVRHTFQPVARRSIALLATAIPLFGIASGLCILASRTSAWQFLSPMPATDFFAAHYMRPAPPVARSQARKNLVLVYVESLEATYRREDLFGRDLLAGLSALNPVSFDAYEQLPGTGWTIAAIVSTQCGVPLELVDTADAPSHGERDLAFLPGAVCLGDVLASHGYRNVFLGGASLAFSAKGKFFRNHRFHEVYGREEWLQHGIAAERLSRWGLHDDDLFDQAKLHLQRLHEAGQPFNLTLLTVDMHWPSGHLSPGCRKRGAHDFAGIVECTANQVADLVRFVRASGYDADTQIVVLGDHLTPPNPLSTQLASAPQRSIYNAFFARTPPQPNRSTLVHFDLLPTLLDFIGLPAEGGRAGLGFSAFGPMPQPAPTAESRAELARRVLEPSRAYARLWDPTLWDARR